MVPNTGISNMPGSVLFDSKIFVFHQGNFNHGDIWYNRFDGTNWLGDQLLCTGCISKSPAAVRFLNKIFVFNQGHGSNGRIEYRYSSDGNSWSGLNTIPNAGLSESPGTVVYNNKLYVFHQGHSLNGELWYTTTTDGVNWGPNVKLNGVGMSASPRAAVVDNKLYVLHQSHGHSGWLWYSVFDGTTWSSDINVNNNGVGISDSPSPLLVGGALYVFHEGQGDNRQLWYTKFLNGQWSPDVRVKINIPFIMTADPQYVWCEPSQNPTCNQGPDNLALSYGLIKSQYQSMGKLHSQIIGPHIQGVMINGDLTEHGHPWQMVTSFQDLMVNYLGFLPRYLGLGNHDYTGNLGRCGNSADNNGCASRMVDFMWTHIRTTPGLSYHFSQETLSAGVYKFKGSLAYSFNIENIHIVQLQYAPLYEKSWYNYQPLAPVFTGYYEITSSISWLQSDLNAAVSRGDKIIICMHHWGSEWDIGYFQNTILANYPVTAMFAGHFHDQFGIGGNYQNTPLFFSGNPMYHRYLLLTFDINRNKLVVRGVTNNDNGDVQSITSITTVNFK
eukprot:gene2444-3018_t